MLFEFITHALAPFVHPRAANESSLQPNDCCPPHLAPDVSGNWTVNVTEYELITHCLFNITEGRLNK